mmetsp:Transcript_8334/g.30740  ORF Transcript_8334/g.30740 Transcript_8334/m.30740 type:complete len:203 (+) Transcript_8334:278-886(+)
MMEIEVKAGAIHKRHILQRSPGHTKSQERCDVCPTSILCRRRQQLDGAVQHVHYLLHDGGALSIATESNCIGRPVSTIALVCKNGLFIRMSLCVRFASRSSPLFIYPANIPDGTLGSRQAGECNCLDSRPTCESPSSVICGPGLPWGLPRIQVTPNNYYLVGIYSSSNFRQKIDYVSAGCGVTFKVHLHNRGDTPDILDALQ